MNAKKKNKKLALNSGIQTNDDEFCIPSCSSIFVAVQTWKAQKLIGSLHHNGEHKERTYP